MKPRHKAVELIQSQMHGDTPAYDKKEGCHHYGYNELRELLDFIYESKPSDNELLIDSNKQEDIEAAFPTFNELFPEPEEKEITQDMLDEVKNILSKPE